MATILHPEDHCEEMWLDPICPGEMYDLVPDDYDPDEDLIDADTND